jgi:hypothetical protein
MFIHRSLWIWTTFYCLSIFLVSVGTGHGLLGALFGVADLLLQVVFLILFSFFFPGAHRPVFVSYPWSGFSFLTEVAVSCFVSSVPRSPGITRPVGWFSSRPRFARIRHQVLTFLIFSVQGIFRRSELSSAPPPILVLPVQSLIFLVSRARRCSFRVLVRPWSTPADLFVARFVLRSMWLACFWSSRQVPIFFSRAASGCHFSFLISSVCARFRFPPDLGSRSFMDSRRARVKFLPPARRFSAGFRP